MKNKINDIIEDELSTDAYTWGLAELCSDLFLIAIRIKSIKDTGDPVELRHLILLLIDDLYKKCKNAKVNNESVKNIIYALVALIDEIILNHEGKCKDYWELKPLQLEIFGEITAGEKFYQIVEKLIIEPDKNIEVLEIYFLCLSLGFEGKYKIKGEENKLYLLKKLFTSIQKRYDLFINNNTIRADEETDQKIFIQVPKWYFVMAYLTMVLMIYCFVLLITDVVKVDQIIEYITQIDMK